MRGMPDEETPSQSAEHSDARQADRLQPAAECHVFDVLEATPLGEVLNISSEGLMLASALSIEEGSLYQVEIHCALDEVPPIAAGIECLWTAPHGNGGTLAGFQIIDISQAGQDALYRLLEASC